jgi:electron transport complex protein RnfG
MNKTVIKMILVLVVVGIISGGTLAAVYRVAHPLIEKNKLEELRKAIFVVLPEAKSYKNIKKGDLVVYQGLDSQGSPVGVAFVAEGNGFQGKIRLMVGMDNELTKIKGLLVLENVETPGLGGRISEEGFQKQFKGVIVRPQIEYVKNMKPEKSNQVQAITGATISSSSVVKITNSQIKKVLEVLGP